MEIRHCVELCDAKMPYNPKIKIPNEDRCQDTTWLLMEKFKKEKQNKTKPFP